MRQEVQHPARDGAARYARAGEMTSVMAAVATATGRHVLRIGMVERGRVTDERLVRERGDVTVGPTEKSTFVVLTETVPRGFKLFERVGDGYALNFVDGMRGRIALATGIADLTELRDRAKVVRQGGARAYQIPLTDAARGRVVVGEATFLFQFVAAPLAQARPQLPLSVKTGVGVDWTTTVIAAISFLFHFGLVGAIYSDWLDPLVDDNLTITQLVDAVGRLPPAPPVETKPDDPTAKPMEVAPALKTASPNAPAKAGNAVNPKASTGKPPQMSDNKAAALANQLKAIDIEVAGVINAAGPATDKVLQNSDLATQRLDEAARESSRVDHALAGLQLGGPGYTGRPGDNKDDSLIGGAHRGNDGPTTTGKIATVKAPVGNVDSGLGGVTGGTISNAGSVVAAMRGAFRRCYENGLRDNPDMGGGFTIVAKVGPNGEVLSSSISGGSGSLTGTVMGCAKARVDSAQFARPDGGGATVVIPIGMKHQ